MMTLKLDRLQHAIASLGGMGVAGLILVVAALMADAMVVAPLEQDVDALAERNARAALLRPKAGAKADSAGQAGPALAETAEDTLRHLFESAKTAGLSLDQGDYQLGQGLAAGQSRYQLSLPVQGNYADIRDFIARMLNDDPALALASVNLTRTAIEEREIEADLQFVLYLKGAP
ncbi:MAG: hypothetical protein HGA75_09940 [Thiobacillus sp.]|nr:hypothetical protein [Thiobacillus sp.]